MAKIKFLEKDNKTYSFLIEGVDYSILNFLRRTISYNLSIYAIDEVDFYENNSVVFDEMLANRIALSPITTPLVNTGKKVTFNLEADGPKTVYTKDFVSNDSEIKMVYDTIPLTKLNNGERVKLIAYATLGKGREHAKYMSAILSYSRLYELENLRSCEECKNIFNKTLESAIFSDAKKITINPKDYDLLVSQIESCNKKCLKINPTNNYILYVELIGQIEISELFKLTERHFIEFINVLKKKLK